MDNIIESPKPFAKKSLLTVGIALLCFLIATEITGFLLIKLTNALYDAGYSWAKASYMKWILTVITNYIVGIPIFYLVLRKLPKEKRQGEKLSASSFFKLFVVCIPLMYIGNIFGNILSYVISSGNAENILLDYASDLGIPQILIMVLIGPFLEELVFRKLILDRTTMFGESAAVLFSAVAFGLFHENLYQFFYAFLLGLVFGYVYLRTKNIIYSFLMHMTINFFGSVVASSLLRLVDMDKMTAISQMTEEELLQSSEYMSYLSSAMLGMIVILIYFAVLIALSITGIVFICKGIKKLRFYRGECELEKGKFFRYAYLNIAYIIFFIGTLFFTFYNIGVFGDFLL